MLGKLREKMSSMHISENLVKNTLKNRWIKTKQCGKQRRTVHKANPEVSHCQAPLTHATLTAWMWRTRPQVHIQESKNQSLQQSEVGVWAIGRAYLRWSFKTQGRQGWVRNQRQCLLAACHWRSKENWDWTVSHSADIFLGLDELKLKELFTQPVSYWEFLLFWLWPGLSSQKTVCKGKSRRISNHSEMSPC